MGFLKKIGHKFHKAKSIGKKFAHGVAIGLRKTGKVIQRGAEIAGKVAPVLEVLPDPRLRALGETLDKGSIVASQVGSLTANVGRSGEQLLNDSDGKAFLERSKAQRKEAQNLFKN